MAEDVSTGGLKKFRYDHPEAPKLSNNEKSEIRRAYEKADKRRRKERLTKWIIWIITLLILFGIGIYFLLR